MSSYNRHGYVNNQQQAGRQFSDGEERGYVNDQDLSSSVQYEVTDYDSLNNSERDKDKHIYRGLDLRSDGRVTQEGVVKRRAGDGNTDNGDPSYKARGQRTLIVVIVVLVALLVAMAAAFGFLYFKRTDDAPELPTQETPETKQESSAPEATTSRSTTATSTAPNITVPLTTSSAETTQGSTTPGATINTTTSAPTTKFDSSAIQERCWLYRFGLIPHPQECQAYYNCSYRGFQGGIFNNFEPFLMECPYPQLFNAETSACEHFEHVTCGERKEAKQGCDYRAIRCAGSHCSPCDIRYPSCAGKVDGFNVHEQKKWSPFYINCYKERYVSELLCPGSYGDLVFSPEYGGCVALDRIPTERGGIRPNCTGKKDGFHMNERKKWSAFYIICYKERYVAELTCPRNPITGTQIFSPEYGGCVGLDRIPSEHGGHQPNCTGKEDGFYPNKNGVCSKYTECVFGQYKMTWTCPESQRFDEATKKCSESPTSLCICNQTGCTTTVESLRFTETGNFTPVGPQLPPI